MLPDGRAHPRRRSGGRSLSTRNLPRSGRRIATGCCRLEWCLRNCGAMCGTCRSRWTPNACAAASAALVGRHDFAAFQASGSDVVTTVREVIASRVIEPLQDTAASSAAWPLNLPPLATGRLIGYEITGTGFLRHMVRNIVGTLVDIGRARRPIDDMTAILASRDRSRAGGHRTPAHGLVLWEVEVLQAGRQGLRRFLGAPQAGERAARCRGDLGPVVDLQTRSARARRSARSHARWSAVRPILPGQDCGRQSSRARRPRRSSCGARRRISALPA